MKHSIVQPAIAGIAALMLGSAIVAGCAGNGTSVEAGPAYGRVLPSKLVALFKDAAVPGAVVVVQSRELGNWSATFGTRRIGSGEPITIDDHFRIGSNTKTMTGTVVLQLAQDGKLRLEDPVSMYHSGVPNGDRITIEQLLSMRSGLSSYTAAPEWIRSVDDTPQRAWRPEELLAIAFVRKPNFAPARSSNTATPTPCCSAWSSRS
jgi:D-alanyl-D-alanine carboxypeptidase